jgi:hypothetical protein
MSVTVAVIDSGVNPGHPHVNGVAGGVAFHPAFDGGVATSPAFHDAIGHGTAVAGIIRQGLPAAGLFVLKIFGDRLRASAKLLSAALEWAVDQRIKVIHLSLGTSNPTHRPALERLCRLAYERELVVVASARGPDDLIWPSALETVVGVFWDPACGPERIAYHPGRPIPFGAHGWPRPLPGLPQAHNLRGHSFAAARVTAEVARLLAQNPGGSPDWVRQQLILLGDVVDKGYKID